MEFFSTTTVLLILVASLSEAAHHSPPAPMAFTPSPAPAPAPASPYVNLTDLLSVAGPFHTFLDYLQSTKVIDTFQDQANKTHQGITLFVPKDSAFSAINKPPYPSLSNITSAQLKQVMLFHGLPHFYTFADFKNLSESGPVPTFAGAGQFALNFTYLSGLVRIDSGWSKTKVSSSVHSTDPVAVYQVDRVLLPEAVFGTDIPPMPAPAPAPEASVAPAAADAPSADATAALGGKNPGRKAASNSGNGIHAHGFGAVLGFCGVVMLL